MPAVASNHIEISSFCHATREPAVDRARSIMAVGRAMMATLDAQQALERALVDRFGSAQANETVKALSTATEQVWDLIDEALSEKRSKAA